jgi:excinuclease ABC subunit A
MSESIQIKNARVHNLKSVSLEIPYDKLVVVTGLSGSGKSSLVYDTLFAEGQRRYIESLSSYARQFFGRLSKPDVDMIDGLPPAIAIRQKVTNRSPRSTVGTLTEIYDYLKLLYARVGITYSPISGEVVRSEGVEDVELYLSSMPDDVAVYVCYDMDIDGDRRENWMENIRQQGFVRVWCDGKIQKLDEIVCVSDDSKHISVVLDRLKKPKDESSLSRLRESVEQAFNAGNDQCLVVTQFENQYQVRSFSSRFEHDGIIFEEPTENLFSFNSPVGACPVCEGYGSVIGVDEDLVIPDKSLSIYDDAVMPWKGDKMAKYKDDFIMYAAKIGFPVHRPYIDLSGDEKAFLWNGNQDVEGIYDFFKYLDSKKYKIQYRVILSRYRGKTICPECKGKRLKKEAGYVKVGSRSLPELVDMPINKLKDYFDELSLDNHDFQLAERILYEISSRLDFMQKVGLSYLSLNRRSATLSGGETQRINLVTSLGSSLVGSLYILDEPSVGLHPRDTHLLIDVLKQLRDLGNTVIVVEHEESVIRAADQIVDIGPGAGYLGGEVLFNGRLDDLLKLPNSLTGDYLSGKQKIHTPEKPKQWKAKLVFEGLRQHNLKIPELIVPLEVMTVITGVSGSGKSSFVRDILTPAVKRKLGDFSVRPGTFKACYGDFGLISDIQFVDQNPIGKSSRSNPVTYIKAWDEIRSLYSDQPLAKQRKYKPAFFSFNVDGGRCENCKGEGQIKVEMQFMADVYLECEVCKGKRFKDEILEVYYHEKNIYDLLEMTIDEAVLFFSSNRGNYEDKIVKLLKRYQDVGLGYLKMGQSSSTLSGGESQRIKLASYLSKENIDPGMFIFDEPTTGLHFHDINKLLDSLEQLKHRGHTIVIVEHNPEVIKSADWVIDLGPEGGENGGELVFAGTPRDLVNCEKSFTGKYLKL